MSRRFGVLIFVILLSLFANLWAASFDTPRLGIVISKSSFEHNWGVTQMSAHGWAGIANLAGIPYDCLFMDDIAASKNLEKYDLLIFAQCSYVDDAIYPAIVKGLQTYLEKGGNLIIDGPLAKFDQKARERRHENLDDLLGLAYDGFRGGSDFRVKVIDNSNYVTRPFEVNQYITQHQVNGLNILQFKQDGQTLLTTTDERQPYPFLSVRKTEENRIILVSDFSTWAGVASFFRNVQPQVFYANQLFNIMIRALHWAIYDDIATPFPVPQVSNANLTAIVRLDADGSNNLNAQIATMNYLVDLAKETGVVPVYAWVSSGATKAGWQDLAPLGKKIEDVGGEIGTHSKFHRIGADMTEESWREELDGAIEEIEFNMDDYGYPIGKVEWFINPGNTIRMSDYEQIAKRFSFYMTHGFEQDMPIGWGNLTWYTGPHKNLVVLENIPSPDYQWFNDPTWSYTTQQITAYEEAIFDHLFDNIGHGVIFNEMWHDYSITTQPQKEKERIVNKSNIEFYDAMKAKFATHRIYCPTPEDLGHKLRAMAQWDYSWSVTKDRIDITLDLSNVLLDTIPYFVGGMGLKIENTHDCIQSVSINEQPHFAFDDRVIILPNLQKGVNRISVTLGSHPSAEPRLTFVSKLMPAVRQIDEGLETQIITKTKAKFTFFAPQPSVILNADWQEWNRNGDSLLDGFVMSDRRIMLKKIDGDFALTKAGLPIMNFKEDSSSVTLTLANREGAERMIAFRSDRTPQKITFGDQVLAVVAAGRHYRINLPEFSEKKELVIQF